MKREIFKEVVLVFLSISMILIFGCSEESSITDPIEETNPTLTKNLTADNGSFNMPEPIFKSLQNSFSTTKLVKADNNTAIRIRKDYESAAGPVKVDVKVMLKTGSVAEDTEVTMTFDAVTGSVSFSPYMNLQKDARIEFRFKCAALTEMNKDNLFESAERRFWRTDVTNDEITLENDNLTQLSKFTLFEKDN